MNADEDEVGEADLLIRAATPGPTPPLEQKVYETFSENERGSQKGAIPPCVALGFHPTRSTNRLARAAPSLATCPGLVKRRVHLNKLKTHCDLRESYVERK